MWVAKQANMSMKIPSEAEPLPPSKLPKVVVVARVVTLITLVVSLVVMRNNHVSYQVNDFPMIGARYQDSLNWM